LSKRCCFFATPILAILHNLALRYSYAAIYRAKQVDPKPQSCMFKKSNAYFKCIIIATSNYLNTIAGMCMLSGNLICKLFKGVELNFLELVNQRQSVRSYQKRGVDRDKIDRCIEAARMAPSACNSQPWKFVVIDDPELKNKVASSTYGNLVSINRFSVQAPVLVLVISERQKLSARFGSIVKRRQLKMIDIGIAAEHFCLQATEEGLGSCMMGWFSERRVNKLLGIPKSKRVELVISIGYSASDEIRSKTRKPIDEMRSFNKY